MKQTNMKAGNRSNRNNNVLMVNNIAGQVFVTCILKKQYQL